jgi:hypothetical protein
MTQERLDSELAAAAMNSLYVQTHFQKLAEFGIEPQNEQEAASLLSIAHRLKGVDGDTLSKSAGDKTANDRFAQVNSVLNTHFGSPEREDEFVNAKLAEDPYWQQVTLALARAKDEQSAQEAA